PTGGMPKADIVNWSYGKAETFSLLIPNIKGGASAKPVGGQMAATQMSALPGAQSAATYDANMLLPYFQQYFNEGEGTNGPVYVGAIICALFLVGCVIVKGPVKWALAALTLISIVLAWGRNCEGITDFMIYHFPMYNKFRAVESILVIAEFTMPLLAMLALSRIVELGTEAAKEKKKAGASALYFGFGVPAFFCVLAWLAPGIYQHNDNEDLKQFAGQEIDYLTMRDAYTMSMIYEQLGDQTPMRETFAAITALRRGMVKDDALRSLLFLALGFGLLWLYLQGKAKTAVAGCGIGALVLLDLYGVDKRYLSHESFAPALAQGQGTCHAPDAIDQAILQDKDLSYRVMDIPGFDLPDRSYHHKMIGGYHAAKLNRYEDLIRRRMQAVRQYGYMPELRDDSIAGLYAADQKEAVENMRADYRVLDMLNARYIITGDKEQPVVVNTSALGNAWLVSDIEYVGSADEEMNALAVISPATEAVADERFRAMLGEPAKPSEGDYVKLADYTPNTLTYETSTANDGCVAVFSEIFFPWGWNATIDGEKAEIGRVDYLLRAMRLPAGKHTVAMDFSPRILKVTSSIAYASAILIYLLLILSVGMAAKGAARKDDVA
ncbi:MAG: YfhO family protein, partial [Lachnospiraceae bacterium]|nr:YfhO family protein [Lachnospiraceae bacterium]